MKRTWLNFSLLFIATFSTVTTYVSTKSDAHYRAAEELTKVTHMEENFDKLIEQALDQQIKNAPHMLPYKKVMREFFNKYMGWGSIKNEVIKIYMDAFSEKELKEMTAFYNTPVGQKGMLLFPSLSQKGEELGMKRIQAHSLELNQMIKAESARIYEKQQDSQDNEN